jgi:hypothetical protein
MHNIKINNVYKWLHNNKILFKKDNLVIKIIPNKIKTFELCKIAVIQNSQSLKYIPQKFKKLFT